MHKRVLNKSKIPCFHENREHILDYNQNRINLPCQFEIWKPLSKKVDGQKKRENANSHTVLTQIAMKI
jgi:hypothetical protein